ncbi:unnamed protein product [Eruca vesicaria subsp. sativa]|uniref:S-protein homolog n=1 Tax=Eruca vesicaria subsp. sativa TaxID=29727 RepID=A0ABC8L2I0_ERUVS|nr:unnamed protein product [Eruca vesicaria subsp. sativa]
MLEFKNLLGAGRILKVNCTSNRNEILPIREVKFNAIYEFPVREKGKNRIVWHCHLQDGNHFSELWRAYRGARVARCGQIRAYMCKPDIIDLVRNLRATDQTHLWHLRRF